MFSVMTKSLMLSQGVEAWTFLWTWLCVVTDFFAIFFTLTWVFYSNPLIFGYFGGYSNIFGFVWFCKLTLTTLLPVALAMIIFFGCGYWFLYCAFLCDPQLHNKASARCGFSFVWCCLSPIMAIL